MEIEDSLMVGEQCPLHPKLRAGIRRDLAAWAPRSITQHAMAEAAKGLQHLIERYNTDIHSTIKAEPLEVWEGEETNKQDTQALAKMGEILGCSEI